MAQIRIGQTVHLMGGDSGTVEQIYGGDAYQIRIGEALTWVRAGVINELKRTQRESCHYCGMPASDVGFFGEPVCRECR